MYPTFHCFAMLRDDIIFLIMKRARLLVAITIACLLFGLASCDNTSDKSALFDEEHPEMILKNATYTIYKDKSDPIRMTSETITIYSATKSVFENTSFSQMDSNNVVQITGSCDQATVVDNNKLTLTGNVRIVKVADDAIITCDSLSWNNKTGSITSNGDVSILFSDGSEIIAGSFSANTGNSVYKFEEITAANFITKDESKISIRCDSLIYNKEKENVLSESWIYLEDLSRKASLTGARLEYDKNSSIMQIDMQARFTKETDDGLLTCTAESMSYNTDEQTLIIMGNARITWDKDSYKASTIFIDLDTEEITLMGPITGAIYG